MNTSLFRAALRVLVCVTEDRAPQLSDLEELTRYAVANASVLDVDGIARQIVNHALDARPPIVN